MLIFNTTYLVPDNVYGVWYKWMKEFTIPFMTESGHFIKPQMAKVLGTGNEDGISVSVQVIVRDLETLERWNNRFEMELQKACYDKFGTEVLFFSTILEVLD
jgi:hypothetical protein